MSESFSVIAENEDRYLKDAERKCVYKFCNNELGMMSQTILD